MSDAGRKLIEGLKDALAGNFARVTLDTGEVWVRETPLHRAAPELLKQAKEFDRLSLVIESEICNALGADSPAREGILLAIKANRAAIAKAEKGQE